MLCTCINLFIEYLDARDIRLKKDVLIAVGSNPYYTSTRRNAALGKLQFTVIIEYLHELTKNIDTNFRY